MLTLLEKFTFENEVKKSRFIAVATRVDSPEEALSFLQEQRDPSATHNCWAYRIGKGYRFSDDGEPGGTAGRPILSAIEGQGVDHAVVAVIRFFGGTKLGAGGLVRAYGGVTAECLRRAPKVEVHPMVDVSFTVPFDAIGVVYPLIGKFDGTKISESFTNDGVVFVARIRADAHGGFIEELMNSTTGKAVVTGN